MDDTATRKSVRLSLATVRRVVWWSTAIVIGLGIAREVYIGLAVNPAAWPRAISLDQKHSLQAWQHSTLALAGGALCLLFACSERRDNGLRGYWIALTAIMFVTSIEQQISLHQMTITAMRGTFGLHGPLYFSWVAWAIPLCLGIAAWFVPFLRRLPRRTAMGFVVAGVAFLGGSIGMEMAGGWALEHFGANTPQYKLCYIVEETMESIGLALFVIAAADYWRSERGDVLLAIRPAP